MDTLTADAGSAAKEPPVRGGKDPNTPETAAEREQRFQRRRARLNAVPHIDPRLRDLYLDRTLVTNPTIAEQLGCSEHRVTILRTGSAVRSRKRYGRPLRRPHPSLLPATLAWVQTPGGVWSPAIELGELRQWADQRGTHMLDLETGALVKVPGSVHGKNRRQAALRSPATTRYANPEDDDDPDD